MNAHTIFTGWITGLVLTTAAAALPADRTIYIAIHQNPANPHSRVQYVLAQMITAVEQDGDWIGWEIENYKITEKALLGADTVWDVDYPDVGTTDGLWWVEHYDPDNPVPADFAEAAPVADRAIANDPANPDLYFDVAGVPYTAPPGGPPYELTGAISFTFSTTANANDPPDDSGDDEPVDSPDNPNPPNPTAH